MHFETFHMFQNFQNLRNDKLSNLLIDDKNATHVSILQINWNFKDYGLRWIKEKLSQINVVWSVSEPPYSRIPDPAKILRRPLWLLWTRKIFCSRIRCMPRLPIQGGSRHKVYCVPLAKASLWILCSASHRWRRASGYGVLRPAKQDGPQ